MRSVTTVFTAVILIFFGGQFAISVAAASDSDPTGGATSDLESTVIVGVETSGKAGDSTQARKPSGAKKRVCTYDGEKVPCKSDDGLWDGGCYVKAVDPQPAKSDAIWRGNEDGLIATCTPPCAEDVDAMGNAQCAVAVTQWVPSLPDAPDPAVLAQRAVDRMQLRPIEIGIVPEDKPGSVGIVGMPQWMWVSEPAANTFGPVEASASAGGYTVRATGNVEKTVWDMGDGTQVTCMGPGTAYEDQYGKSDSPDCGHRYTKQGEYQVTATSYWTVSWEGIGQTGTIPVELDSSTNIVMGEAQVITQ